MIDQKLYRETFSRLRASEEAKREVLERKRRGGGRLPQLLRGTVIAAAMCMALAVTAGAVNIATDGELFRRFTIVWTGEDELLATDGQGIEVQITLADQGPVWEQDGRVLVRDGDGAAVDITGQLTESGRYHTAWEMTVIHGDGGEEVRTVTLDVTGAPGDWTAVQDNGDGSRAVVTSSDRGAEPDVRQAGERP